MRIAPSLLVMIGSNACFFAVGSTTGRVGAGLLFVSGSLQLRAPLLTIDGDLRAAFGNRGSETGNPL